MTGTPDASGANRNPRSRSPITGKYQTQMPVEAEVQVDPPVKPITTWEAPAGSAAFNGTRDPAA
jgi:hypothetical protein